MAGAYAPYRSAMFYLRAGNPDVAYLDLDAAQAAWQSVIERFGEAPPDAFADDENFDDALTSVQKTLETSQSLIDKNDRMAAMERLASVRQELAMLRSRKWSAQLQRPHDLAPLRLMARPSSLNCGRCR